ncbi:TetR family transcriptional regulator [Paraburkholderia humisilvae]|uniref:HTH-type transcriptional regulator TtgR n=1 Tax=Paraburkholderia humisilvae TaxID=627669 RepID=A0A6J5DDU5_9BURK|nr:TetR family transcriptional regulator [Paraburkholderia humisilvae]CAB3751597.1 HTH-type transcriptional regulator TtgR [Paraburkholderia humisilvae]
MRRTREDALKTRDQILDAAEVTFFQHGFSHTSLAQIAERAGLTRGAIYGHFKNKCEVFNAMAERVKLPMEMLVTATFDPREADPLGRIRDLFMFCLAKAAIEPHSRRVFEVLFTKCEYTEELAPVLERQRTAARDGRARMELGLRNAIDKGQLPPELDTTRAAGVLQMFLGGVLRDWLLDYGSVDLPRDAKFLADACIGMLRNSPALRRHATSAG